MLKADREADSGARRPGDVRLLVLATAGHKPSDEELRRLIAEDLRPDAILAEDSLGATSLDERDLARIPGLHGRVLQRLPVPIALALEVWRRRHDFDAVLSWGEQLAFPLALLLTLSPRRRMAHIGILMWPCYTSSSSRLKLWIRQVVFPLLARHGMDRLLVPAPRQRALVIERWGISPEHFVPAGWPVDTRFWRPMDGPQDTICSVGREMRDYGTLITALRTLDLPCHIATGASLLNPATADDPRASNVDATSLPAGITVGHKSALELRELYGRSRLVVVPIMPSESDNGATTIHEAMAMGRAVVTTATVGRTEILEDGVNCLLVPERDPVALREAIERLWNDSDLCARLGAAARERIGVECSIDLWLAAIRAAAADAASSRRRRANPLS